MVELHRKDEVLKNQVAFYNDYNNYYGLSGGSDKYYGVANAGATSGSASRLWRGETYKKQIKILMNKIMKKIIDHTLVRDSLWQPHSHNTRPNSRR